jgi:hypothetical protein
LQAGICWLRGRHLGPSLLSLLRVLQSEIIDEKPGFVNKKSQRVIEMVNVWDR